MPQRRGKQTAILHPPRFCGGGPVASPCPSPLCRLLANTHTHTGVHAHHPPVVSTHTHTKTPSCSGIFGNIGTQARAGQVQDSLQDTVLQRRCSEIVERRHAHDSRTLSCNRTLGKIGAQACAGKQQDSLYHTVLQRSAWKYWSAGMRRTAAGQSAGHRPAAKCMEILERRNLTPFGVIKI